MQKKLKFNNQELTFDLPTEADQSVFDEIFRDNEYRLIEDKIRQAQNPILDIGAHIGIFAVYAAKLNPQQTIYSFEPAPDNYQKLKEHLKQNHVKTVISKNVAVTDQKGQVTINLNPDSHNHSLYLPGEPFKVSATTLADVIKKTPNQKASVAKIDCEGAEFPIILNSDDETLKKIDTYFIEYHHYQDGNHVDQIASQLKKLGFKTQKFPSRYQSNLGMLLATN